MLAILLQMVFVLIKDSLSSITLDREQAPAIRFLQADLTSALDKDATAISQAEWIAEAMMVIRNAIKVETMFLFSVGE
jgi:hypothetical protein